MFLKNDQCRWHGTEYSNPFHGILLQLQLAALDSAQTEVDVRQEGAAWASSTPRCHPVLQTLSWKLIILNPMIVSRVAQALESCLPWAIAPAPSSLNQASIKLERS